MQADVLILGQGLAGSTLAWRLAESGVSVAVIDRRGADAAGRPPASRVAAGLITPVTGKRLTVAAGYAEQWATARDFYRGVEAITGQPLLQERPALRLFHNAEERRTFLARGAADHATLAEPSDLPAGVAPKAARHGAFVMPVAARLDTGAYLDATAAWLGDRLLRGECDPNHNVRVADECVTIDHLGVAAELLILCQGHTPAPVRWLDGVRFAPAKGEVITIESRSLRTSQVLHAAGAWIAPCESGAPDRYRVGSTTEWHLVGTGPTRAGREELEAKLPATGVTDYQIVDHQAAVRPATPDRRPVYGFSEAEPRVGWFNGLGAKGSLWAPTYAQRMVDLIAKRIG